jgi:hypothetical protein
MITLNGFDSLLTALNNKVKESEKEVVELRKNVTTDLITSIGKNVPVWSGRTLASVKATNGSGGNAINHPDRGDTSSHGDYHFHPEFGRTNSMSLGNEPMRGTADAESKASLSTVNFDIDQTVTISMNSTAGELVENASAPGDKPARNQAVVSSLAVAEIKSKYGNAVS